MSKVLAFSVFDVKSDSYAAPFFKPARGAALRDFATAVNDKAANSLLARYPADFKLVLIGEFDDQAGRLVGLEVPESLGFGSEFVDSTEGK